MNLWYFYVVLVAVLLFVMGPSLSGCSEFPERECCDSAPPPPPHYHTVTTTSITTTVKPSFKNNRGGVQHKTLNCLEAKKFCDEDPTCIAVLRSVPLLCGPELVACSTVTVSRCQAALRTLVSFSWFDPTCLCKEPKVDPICNLFRDLLFDHPCYFVHRKEIDMHPLEKIPTCEMADDICRNNSWCKQRLEEFSRTCTVSNDKCTTSDKETCIKSWLRVRGTPLLGCTCPNISDHECFALQSLVNRNPCIGAWFMLRTSAMTKAGVTIGSALVRPLPLSLLQPLSLPPVAMLVACYSPGSFTKPSTERTPFLKTTLGLTFETHFPCSHKSFNGVDALQTDPKDAMRQIKHVVGTCDAALQSCQSHLGCKSHLENVSSLCRTYCQQRSCREAVRTLYEFLMVKDSSLALHIGLCICRRTGGRSDTDCVNAQAFLHPECAERSETRSIGQCHRIGRDCRNNKLCRYRLEYYEQACAADTFTGRCAGQHSECLKAAMGLFGSPLHINCVCKGDSFVMPNKCLSWKRLLWGNPCLVESQLTYYLSQYGSQVTIPDPEDNDYGMYKFPVHETIFGGDMSSLNAEMVNKQFNYDTKTPVKDIKPKIIFGIRKENPTGIVKNYGRDYQSKDFSRRQQKFGKIAPGDKSSSFARNSSSSFSSNKSSFSGNRSSFSNRRNPSLGGTNSSRESPASSSNFRRKGGSSFSQARKQESTLSSRQVTLDQGRTPLKQESTTITPSTTKHVVYFQYTTMLTTSTLPAKYCKVTREWDTEGPRIIEAEDSIRIYKSNNLDCSEICDCTIEEKIFCKVLDCTENIPCETSYAVYNHKAPAYQAERGQCICYSGDFICMRPKSEEYVPEPGLFLLLGFSHKEESLMRPFIDGGATEALEPLKKLIRSSSSKMGHDCHFIVTKRTSDNFVLQLFPDQNPSIFAVNVSQQEERDRCKPAIDRIAKMINDRHFNIHNHVQLSLFVLAEVLDNTPNAQLSSGAFSFGQSVLMNCLLFVYYFKNLLFITNHL